MNDKMFELNIFKEDKKETFETKKKKFELNYFKTHKTIDMSGPLADLPFGPFGATAFGMQLMRGLPRPKKNYGVPILGTTLFVKEENGQYVSENIKEAYESTENEESDIYHILLESLNTYEAEELINEFAESHNMKIKIFAPGSKMYQAMKFRNVAFHTIELNDRNNEQLNLLGDIENYYFSGKCHDY